MRRCFRIARAALKRGTEDDAAVAVIMAIAGAESFLTVQALEIAEPGSALHRRILKDLSSRVSFEAKLAGWPSLLFGARLDLERGEGARLLFAKARRNALLHGTPLEEFGSDPTVHPIDADEAADTLDAALWFVGEVLRRRGLGDTQIQRLRQIWTK